MVLAQLATAPEKNEIDGTSHSHMLCGSRKYELELHLLSQRVEERSLVQVEEQVVMKWV